MLIECLIFIKKRKVVLPRGDSIRSIVGSPAQIYTPYNLLKINDLNIGYLVTVFLLVCAAAKGLEKNANKKPQMHKKPAIIKWCFIDGFNFIRHCRVKKQKYSEKVRIKKILELYETQVHLSPTLLFYNSFPLFNSYTKRGTIHLKGVTSK